MVTINFDKSFKKNRHIFAYTYHASFAFISF